MQELSTDKTDFFSAETRLGFTISAEMKKIWAIELDLLRELDAVCKTLGISYFLDCGTLLGAVRDHHFIPWDDDIDVIMPREDYEILKKNGSLFKSSFFFQTAYTDKEYPRGHAQLRKKNTCAMIPYEAKHVKFDQGIFIDIFVLDGVPESPEELRDFFAEKNKLMQVLETIGIPASTKPLNQIIKKLIRPFLKMKYPSFKDLFRKYESLCRRYEDSGFADKIMFRDDPEKTFMLRKEWFSGSIPWEFEGGFFPIPVGYADVLKTYYGDDYLTPANAPTAHGGLILDAERSYKYVLAEMRKRKAKLQ